MLLFVIDNIWKMDYRVLVLVIWSFLFSRTYGQCHGAADIVIAVPGALIVPYFEFIAFEGNLIDLLYHFNIEPRHIHIGLVLYGKAAVPIASPQPFKTRTQVNTRVTLLSQRNQHMLKLGMELNVAEAIRQVSDMLTKAPRGYPAEILRPNARKIGIIFTYGPTDIKFKQQTIDAAAAAMKANILLYALAANGTSLDFPKIGTDYCRLFSMGDFQTGLPSAIPDLASGICSELDPAEQITSAKCFPRRYSVLRPINVICQVENNMVQPDPNNCAYFFRCEYFDTQALRLHCAPNTLFDPLTGSCNVLTNVACYNDISCPTDIPMLYKHPMNCHMFINCANDFIPHVQVCPEGQMFDQSHQNCNETAQVTCTKI